MKGQSKNLEFLELVVGEGVVLTEFEKLWFRVLSTNLTDVTLILYLKAENEPT